MANKNFDTAKNPSNKLWYVVGYCGRNRAGRAQYSPVSTGFKTKREATARISVLARAAVSEKKEILTGKI